MCRQPLLHHTWCANATRTLCVCYVYAICMMGCHEQKQKMRAKRKKYTQIKRIAVVQNASGARAGNARSALSVVGAMRRLLCACCDVFSVPFLGDACVTFECGNLDNETAHTHHDERSHQNHGCKKMSLYIAGWLNMRKWI